MGILSTIISKVFGGKKEATPATAAPTEVVETVIATETAAVPADFDVNGYLNGLRAESKEKLDWTVSIVDLMKLVGMDSSLGARKELAKELGYSGDTADSAKMNIWLHKQVMQQIAKHGGKLPDELVA
jgi:hypothetical protein